MRLSLTTGHILTVMHTNRVFVCEMESDNTAAIASPHNLQGNGHAEQTDQTTKRNLKINDLLITPMIYRASPHSSTGISPAELLMDRQIRTTLPILAKYLQPNRPSREYVQRHCWERSGCSVQVLELWKWKNEIRCCYHFWKNRHDFYCWNIEKEVCFEKCIFTFTSTCWQVFTAAGL